MNNLNFEDKTSPIFQKIENLNEKEKIGIILCANAYYKGGNWGYITKDEESYNDVLDIVGKGDNHIKLYKTKNGVLVLCDRNFIKDAVNHIIPGSINNRYIERVDAIQKREKEKFDKFLDKIFTGKSPYLKQREGYQSLILGVFGINEVNLMVVNEVSYPSYKLSLNYTLQAIIKKNEKYKRKIGIKIKDDDGVKIMPLTTINLKFINKIYNELEISETKNGVFLTLTII
ncbi:TPA: hypothetical protein KQG29_001558 [Clostridioides difficile]|nr:hypothetical protein [Clostridioides difficile]